MAALITISDSEFTLLGEFIKQECGIALQDDKKYLVESRLTTLLLQQGCETFSQFYRHVKNGCDAALKEKIVDAMTTNETLWFRDELPYVTLQEKILPAMAQEMQAGQRGPIRIWSAACSTGQEPYSIAMIAQDLAAKKRYPLDQTARFAITATDISRSALMVAKNARYNGLAMSRGMWPDFQQRYFTEDNGVWCIREDLKRFITFQPFNLQAPFLPLGKFDIIFLRNVAIYFSPEFKTDLFQRIARQLNPGGVLFLGSSETLIGYSNDFQMEEHGRCRYYQVKPQYEGGLS